MSSPSRSRFPPLRVPDKSIPDRRYDALVGTLVEATDGADPTVLFTDTGGTQQRRAAAATVAVTPGDAGRPVILMFLRGDPDCPVITGLLQPSPSAPPTPARPGKLEIAGRELVLTGDAALTLRCGKSSITLTRDGKIVLRGKNLISRASAVNRIRGGMIELN